MAHLVICDDESHITDILTRYFQAKGHEALGFIRGEDALERILAGPVDLVITDISMQGLSGLDLLKRLKATGLDVPVIVTTGNPSHGSAVEALRGGASDYIVKPFHLEEISERVEKALGAKRVKDENLLYSKLVSLHSISRVTAEVVSLEELSTKVIKLGTRLTGSDAGWYWVRTVESTSTLTAEKILFPEAENLEQHGFLINLARRTAEKCELNLSLTPETADPPAWYLSLPVEVGAAVHGVLIFRRCQPGHKYDAVDLEVFNQLAATYALGIRALGLYPKPALPDFNPGGKALEAWARLVGQMVDEHCRGYESKEARVQALGRVLIKALRWPEALAEDWSIVCRVYDIAKLRVPQKLLENRKVLAEDELDFVHAQAAWAGERLASIPGLETAVRVLDDFQENFDGTGKPRGLHGHGLSPLARLLAVADAYVSMCSARPYREAISEGEAMEVIRQGSGKRFDPEIVVALSKVTEI